jgi:hypothetical protein
MKNQVGLNVLYQPPGGDDQHAAIITGWNEATQLANLAVFPDGLDYIVAKNQVKEGAEDGQFQQLGVLSRSAETARREERQAHELFLKLSGVK